MSDWHLFLSVARLYYWFDVDFLLLYCSCIVKNVLQLLLSTLLNLNTFKSSSILHTSSKCMYVCMCTSFKSTTATTKTSACTKRITRVSLQRRMMMIPVNGNYLSMVVLFSCHLQLYFHFHLCCS